MMQAAAAVSVMKALQSVRGAHSRGMRRSSTYSNASQRCCLPSFLDTAALRRDACVISCAG
jgi:hypothetical protein